MLKNAHPPCTFSQVEKGLHSVCCIDSKRPETLEKCIDGSLNSQKPSRTRCLSDEGAAESQKRPPQHSHIFPFTFGREWRKVRFFYLGSIPFWASFQVEEGVSEIPLPLRHLKAPSANVVMKWLVMTQNPSHLFMLLRPLNRCCVTVANRLEKLKVNSQTIILFFTDLRKTQNSWNTVRWVPTPPPHEIFWYLQRDSLYKCAKNTFFSAVPLF